MKSLHPSTLDDVAWVQDSKGDWSLPSACPEISQVMFPFAGSKSVGVPTEAEPVPFRYQSFRNGLLLSQV